MSEPLFAELPYSLAELIYFCKCEQVRHLLDLVKRRVSVHFLAELSAVSQEFDADCRVLDDFGATVGGSLRFLPISTNQAFAPEIFI